MAEKKKLQYVNFIYGTDNMRRQLFRRRWFDIVEESCGELNGIRVVSRRENIKELDDKNIARLNRCLKDYDMSEATVLADQTMAELLGITDMLFQARKYELIHNCSYIVEKLKARAPEDNTMAIVAESDKWDSKDIFSILTVVKNYYKRIDIITAKYECGLERISELVYEEWGLVVNIYTFRNYHRKLQDMVLFFISCEERLYSFWRKKVNFRVAYVVYDRNYNNGIKKLKIANVFSGLDYKISDNIPYEYGVNIAYQKPLIYEKFHVSSIDICEL